MLSGPQAGTHGSDQGVPESARSLAVAEFDSESRSCSRQARQEESDADRAGQPASPASPGPGPPPALVRPRPWSKPGPGPPTALVRPWPWSALLPLHGSGSCEVAVHGLHRCSPSLPIGRELSDNVGWTRTRCRDTWGCICKGVCPTRGHLEGPASDAGSETGSVWPIAATS